jgi:nucleotide-binding universal stress UspA family protein
VLSLQIAEVMIKDKEIPIVLFHATYRDNVDEIKKYYEKELRKMNCGINPDKYEVVIRKTNKLSDAIIKETQSSDLVIMGAPEEGLVRRAMFGDIPLEIARKSKASLILTKKYTGHVKTWFQKFFGSRKTMLE